MECKYCKGKVCDGKRKTVKEWNECKWHKINWEIDTSIMYWFLGKISFGIIPYIVIKIKLKK